MAEFAPPSRQPVRASWSLGDRDLPSSPTNLDARDSEDSKKLARELLEAGVPLSRVSLLFRDKLGDQELHAIARDVVTQGGAPNPSLGLLVLERSKSAFKNPEFLSKHLESLSADPPEELTDPLFMTLMKEPVVLSTGYVLDRSSVVDEQGRLKFRHCPFSRAELKKDVYPLVHLRRKLQEFKEERLEVMASSASKMLEEKSFDAFQQVVNLAEHFIDDLGEETYIHQARRFADLRLAAVTEHGQASSPSDLAKIYIRIHRTLSDKSDAGFQEKARSMERSCRKSIEEGKPDEASQWCDALALVCRSCNLPSSNLARLRLDLARRRGDELVKYQRQVYRELLGDQVAAEKFLKEEGLRPEDVCDLRPIALLRTMISDDQANDHWHMAVQSKPLELRVEKVIVGAANFHDQGWGNQKGNLGLGLYDAEGSLLTRCNLFGTYRSNGYAYGDTPLRTLGQDDEVVARAEPGCFYRLEYTVGLGGGHHVNVTQFLCRIYPTGWTDDLITCRLTDPEGDEGSYLGPCDNAGRAHGIGRLEYDDCEVFIGKFIHGAFDDGVMYRGSTAKFGVRGPSWTQDSPPDAAMLSQYPHELDWLTVESEAPPGFGDSDESMDEEEEESDLEDADYNSDDS